jgi:hypothetical protein
VNTEELVELVTTSVGPHQQSQQWSYPDYVDLRDANTGITLIGWAGAQSEITFQATGGSKMRASTMFVPANYFKTLGVGLARGAGFDASADDPLRAEPVVILNDQFWRKHLSADPDIVGKTLTLDGVPHVVVGVAPDQFGGHLGFTGWDLFVPLERHPRLLGRTAADVEANFRADRSKEWLNIHGRLSPGPQRPAGECSGCRGHRAIGQGVSGDQRVQGRDRRGVRSAGHSPASATQNDSSRGGHAHGLGAARRLAEYLRHDAGSWRDA